MPKRRTDNASKSVRKTTRGVQVPATVPSAPGALVDRPVSLEGRAAEIWDQHAPELIKIGMLTSRDALMFGLWCQLGAKIENGGLTPALVTQFRLLGNDFGQSPSGKGRELGVPALARKPHKFFKD